MSVRLYDEGSDEIEYCWRDAPLRMIDIDLRALQSSVPHWHTEPEFVLILSGEAVFSVQGEDIHLDAGDILYINAGRIHQGVLDRHLRGICRILSFRPSMFPTCSSIHKRLSWMCKDQRPDTVVMRRDDMAYDPLRAVLDTIADDYRRKDAARVATDCGELIVAMSMLPAMRREHVADVAWLRLREMIGAIQLHYAAPLTTKDIAVSGMVSEVGCRQLFRKLLNTTPTQFLIGYRLERARRLLAKGSSAAQAGAAAGFSTGSYFAEMFHRRFSMTPRQYQRCFHDPGSETGKHR